MPNPGLKGRLLKSSIEAYVLSLEMINRLSSGYRLESFSILICNAWELLLKAKVIKDRQSNDAVFKGKRKKGEVRLSKSLDECLAIVFNDALDPVRRNIEMVSGFRNMATHLVITKVPNEIMGLFQACVLNYNTHLHQWFGTSLSDRVSIGMMTLVYDFDPADNDLTGTRMRRQLGRDTAEYQQDREFFSRAREKGAVKSS